MATVVLNPFQNALRLLADLAVEPVGHHLGVADDGVQGRAQLVAHVGQELRLVLARDLELTALLLDLGEQAHVLDGDHRLGGEAFCKLDLARCERSGIRPAQQDRADCLALAQHGRAQHGAHVGSAGHVDRRAVLGRI